MVNKMSIQIVCDICKKDDKYVTFRLRNLWGADLLRSGYEGLPYWKNIDICDTCISRIQLLAEEGWNHRRR